LPPGWLSTGTSSNTENDRQRHWPVRGCGRYYRRFWTTAWKGFKAATGEQVIGALLAIAILCCQIKLGVIHAGDIRSNAWAIAWPYIILVGALLLWHLLLAPYELDALKEADIDGKSAEILALSKKVEALQQEIDAKIPRLGFKATIVSGSPELGQMQAASLNVEFVLRHLGGRPATSISVDPIASYSGIFTLYLDNLPYIAVGQELTVGFEVWRHEQRPGRKLLHALGWGKLLADFLWDSRPEGDPAKFPVTIRFRDGDEYRTQRFQLLFNRSAYRFDVVDEIHPIESAQDSAKAAITQEARNFAVEES
jgi:hypothetical protein